MRKFTNNVVRKGVSLKHYKVISYRTSGEWLLTGLQVYISSGLETGKDQQEGVETSGKQIWKDVAKREMQVEN